MVASDLQLWLTAALIAGSVGLGVLLLVGVVDAAREGRKRRSVNSQLEQLAGSGEAAVRSQLLRAGADAGDAGGVLAVRRKVFVMIEQAGSDWTFERFCMLSGFWALAGLGAGLLLSGNPLPTAGGAVAGSLLPYLHLRRMRAKRIALMEEQLPEAIDLLNRTVRAGHALTMGLRMVAEESPEPLAGEFRRMSEEQRYGLPFEESVLSLAERVPLADMRILVTALLIQRDVGGNLTEILDKLSHLIRQRFTLQREIKVLTAEGRLSAVVLGVMPTGVGLLLFFMNPEYVMGMFGHPIGQKLAIGAVGLQIVGYLWARNMAKIAF